MIENIKSLSMILMNADMRVAVICLELNNINAINCTMNVLQEDLLPPIVKNKISTIERWLIDRCVSMDDNRIVGLVRFVTRVTSRNILLPFLLSLQHNSVSFSDKYWLQPVDLTNFYYNDILFSFPRSNWNTINPFYRMNIHCDFMLNDLFSYQIQNANYMMNCQWTCNGNWIKQWKKNNVEHVLYKRTLQQNLQNEINTFFLCEQYNIHHPDYTVETLVTPRERTRYNTNTLRDGMLVIKKQCITTSDLFLIPAIQYIKPNVNIENLISNMASDIMVSKNDINNIKRLLTHIQQSLKNNECIDTNNFGLLTDGKTGIFTVWSKLITSNVL